MSKRIVIVQGHPDASRPHFCHALAAVYAEGARDAGHEAQTIDVGSLDFPLLRSSEDYYQGDAPDAIARCQEIMHQADHLLIVYPLWMGSMPALLKGFIEQAFRPGFALLPLNGGGKWQRLLKGKSARIVITMGMPALVYRWYFGAHSLKSLERNILKFSGITPIRESLVGMVDAKAARRRRWLKRLRRLGSQGR